MLFLSALPVTLIKWWRPTTAAAVFRLLFASDFAVSNWTVCKDTVLALLFLQVFLRVSCITYLFLLICQLDFLKQAFLVLLRL